MVTLIWYRELTQVERWFFIFVNLFIKIQFILQFLYFLSCCWCIIPSPNWFFCQINIFGGFSLSLLWNFFFKPFKLLYFSTWIPSERLSRKGQRIPVWNLHIVEYEIYAIVHLYYRKLTGGNGNGPCEQIVMRRIGVVQPKVIFCAGQNVGKANFVANIFRCDCGVWQWIAKRRIII